MSFKVGDMVTHRVAGDDKMIVIDVRGSSYPILCRRYNRTKDDFETKSFKEEELELAEKKEREHLT